MISSITISYLRRLYSLRGPFFSLFVLRLIVSKNSPIYLYGNLHLPCFALAFFAMNE
jgi:hypothetical protein